jgi:hypothetical protein
MLVKSNIITAVSSIFLNFLLIIVINKNKDRWCFKMSIIEFKNVRRFFYCD